MKFHFIRFEMSLQITINYLKLTSGSNISIWCLWGITISTFTMRDLINFFLTYSLHICSEYSSNIWTLCCDRTLNQFIWEFFDFNFIFKLISGFTDCSGILQSNNFIHIVTTIIHLFVVNFIEQIIVEILYAKY